MNLYTTQDNYTTNSLVHTATNDRIVNDKPSNQGVKTVDDQCHNTHQESIILNTVTENDIYDNYSYTSRINWEIEKTPETHLKKIEFNIGKPETSLKKIDFNIITNNNEIDDMNNDIIVHPSDELADDMYNNIGHQTAQQKQTNHNSIYTLADNKIQSSSDLGEQNEAVDWKSTKGHKDELVVAYDNKVENRTLQPGVFYMLYVRPNNDGNGHLIYRLSTDQILVIKEYQSVPVPEDLIKATSETESYDNKNQTNRFGANHPIVQDDHSNNNNDYVCIHPNDKDDCEDKSYDELDCSQQLFGMRSNKIIEQENQNLLTMGSNNSPSVSVKHNGKTCTSTFLHCLFAQYLHKVVITNLCLQPFLQIYVHGDALRHLYEDPYTVLHLQLSLLTSLRNEFPRPSLLMSLRNRFLRLSLLVSLQSNFPLTPLLTSHSYDVSTNISLQSHL